MGNAAKKTNTVPTCLGHYDRGDDVCDGEPNGATADDRLPCAWRDRCGGFKCHLESTGEAIDKYLTFVDEDTATVPNRDAFAEFCKTKAEAFKIVEGLPNEDDEDDDEDFSDLEDEDEEDADDEDGEDEDEDDDEEDADEEDDAEDDASTDDHDDDVDDEDDEAEDDDEEDRGDPDFVDGDGDDDEEGGDDADLDDDGDDGEVDDDEEADDGEASTNDEASSKPARKASLKGSKAKKPAEPKPKGERDTNSKWAAQQRRESLALYRHFEEALSERLNGYAFASDKQAPLPGQLYVADRRELSGYVSIYCKVAFGRDIPVVSIKLKARATEIDVDLPVTAKMLRARLSKAKLAKLDVKQRNGGRFKARISGLDKEKAAIVAEVVHELVKTEAIKLPKPVWA